VEEWGGDGNGDEVGGEGEGGEGSGGRGGLCACEWGGGGESCVRVRACTYTRVYIYKCMCVNMHTYIHMCIYL